MASAVGGAQTKAGGGEAGGEEGEFAGHLRFFFLV